MTDLEDELAGCQALLDAALEENKVLRAELEAIKRQKPACYMGTYNSADIREMYTKVMRNIEDFRTAMPDRIDPLYRWPAK